MSIYEIVSAAMLLAIVEYEPPYVHFLCNSYLLSLATLPHERVIPVVVTLVGVLRVGVIGAVTITKHFPTPIYVPHELPEAQVVVTVD